MRASSRAIVRIAGEIGRYLEANPNASDNVRGIQRWWLASRSIEASEATVRAALERLEAEGLVQATAMADGEVVYGRSGKRRGGRGPS